MNSITFTTTYPPMKVIEQKGENEKEERIQTIHNFIGKTMCRQSSPLVL
jgi:hypothetical protein